MRRHRGDHSWRLVYEGPRKTGEARQRQFVAFRGTRHAADAKLTELIRQAQTGAFVRPTKQTLGAFLESWLTSVSTHVRPTTAWGYRSIVKTHLLPHLGHIALTDLAPSDLQEYYGQALTSGRRDGKGEGLSARSVVSHHRVIREALGLALRMGLVARNVAEAVDPPRAIHVEMKVLNAAGVKKVLELAEGTQWHPLFHLALYSGLRRSEILAVRWKDLDLLGASLSVTQAMHHLRDGRTVFTEPKSARSRRQVALSPASALTLRAYRERREAQAVKLGMTLYEDDLVFTQYDGRPFLPDSVSHAWMKLCRKAGYPGVRLHDARHTHASLLLAQGVNVKIISERLGHASVATTMDLYAHVSPTLQRETAAKFDAILEGAKPERERTPA